VTIAYQWLRAGVAIAGATSATYTPVDADAGKAVSVAVTGSKTGHLTVTQNSSSVSVTGVFTKTPKPKISGTAKVGKKLTAGAGTWAPKATLKYQWFANGKKISGATKATYKVAKQVAGKKLTVTVTGTKSGYQSKAATSAATKKVAK
jgi:hypothetical protein